MLDSYLETNISKHFLQLKYAKIRIDLNLRLKTKFTLGYTIYFHSLHM